MRQTELTLSNKDRKALAESRSKGLRHARKSIERTSWQRSTRRCRRP